MANHRRPSRCRPRRPGFLTGLFSAILALLVFLPPLAAPGAATLLERGMRLQPALQGALSLSADGAAGTAAQAPPAPQGAGLLPAALVASICVCLVLSFALAKAYMGFRTERERMQADRLRLQLSEERYRLLALSSDVVVFELNITDRTVEASENFERLLGQCPDLNNVLTADRIHHEDRDAFAKALQEAVSKPTSVSCEFRLLNGTNKYVWYSVLLSSFADGSGKVVRVLGQLTNIDREKREKTLLELCAKSDMMTGLLNKATTEDLISLSISDGRNQTDALLILDVDNLKLINDTLGHAEGDKAILAVAETLKSHFRSTDIIGRVGGDEFMVFLRNIGNESRLRNSLVTLVQKLSRIRIGENCDVMLHASIGAVVSTGEDSFETLYRKADKAMYFVKRSGKNDYAFYSPEMERAVYHFTGNVPEYELPAELFDADELDQLLSAVCTYFKMVAFTNLSQNAYSVMHCEYQTGFPCDSGIFDALLERIAVTFFPNSQEAFAFAFSRRALFALYGQGHRCAVFSDSRPVENGSTLRTEATAIFVEAKRNEDLCAVLLIRES